jgi:cytoskeletal protein RodZ
MNPDPRVRRGAHRTSRAASATLLPSLLAILAVTSLITALYVWRGEDAKPPSAAASSGSPSPQVDTTTSPASATGTTAATTEPVKASSGPSATHKAKVKTKADTAAALQASVAIVVLNQTARSGLAATVATQLRGKGWTVSNVGNFRGVVPATTVYYPAGKEAAAAAAAKSLPTPPRILPRFGNLSTTRLTVIVTTNYPS